MSRIDKLKQQHPELNVTIIDLMAKVDPTGSYKYTEFLIKRIKEGSLSIEDFEGKEKDKIISAIEKEAKIDKEN